jgi:hypothetical protein
LKPLATLSDFYAAIDLVWRQQTRISVSKTTRIQIVMTKGRGR